MKRERLEDLGKLSCMLKDILDHEVFEHTETKHGYEDWVKINHDKKEYDEPRGLDHIFCIMRHLKARLEDCYYLADGETE